MNTSIYDFTCKDSSGNEISLSDYRGKTLLIVNTASKCGFTPQYDGLQSLQDQYASEKFSVLAFPCNQFGGQEPGTDNEIQEFCSLNFKTTFLLFLSNLSVISSLTFSPQENIKSENTDIMISLFIP